VEEIPIDIGPRHFDVRVYGDGSGYTVEGIPKNGHQMEGVEGRGTVFFGGVPGQEKIFKRGDKVRVSIPRDRVQGEGSKYLKALQEMGVQVQIAIEKPEEKVKRESRINRAEELSPVQVFSEYARLKGLCDGAIRCGNDILRGMSVGSHARKRRHVSFDNVEIENYFSFKDAQMYDLNNRGLVVVTGQLKMKSALASDGDATVGSNGAGKTALAMAPLWALTGHVDSRSDVRNALIDRHFEANAFDIR